MDLADVNAVAYPTWVTAPSRVAGPTFADTEMISLIAGTVGSPAITVPMGYLANGVPLGLELMARPREESLLLTIAAEYERRTRHRRPPPLGPPTPK